MEKKDEEKINEVIENLKVYRGVFIRKNELTKKLNEAIPDQEKKQDA